MEREEQILQDQVIGTEEAMARLYMELLNPQGDKLKTVTDVTPSEVFGMPVMFMFGKIFRSDLTRAYGEDFMRLRISRVRSSRQEFIFLGSGMALMNQDKGRGRSIGDLFQGLRSR